jgi:CRP/FNR family cyclic AMP-dependent transcriptional regulator
VTDPYPPSWRPAVRASFLGQLSEEVQKDLLARSRELVVAPKKVLYAESPRTDSPHLLLVLDGLVRVFRTSRSGRELTLRHARAGDILGLPSVIAQASPGAIQSVVTTRLVVMSPSRLRVRAQQDGRLAWAIAQELAGSLFNIQERLAHNVFAAVRSRVARYLLDVAVRQNGTLVAATSHEDVAAGIGTVREVVARTLAAFRQEGLAVRTDTGILLADVEELRRIAQTDEFSDFRIRR